MLRLLPSRPRPLSGLGGRARIMPLAAVACASALLLAACGSSSTSGSSTASGFAAYRACLSKHGVKLPSQPSGGGFGGFGGSGFQGGSGTFQKAAQACASLRPAGGPGGFGGGGFGGGGFSGFATALKAFRSCMSAHGEPIPSTRPTAPPSGGSSFPDRFLNGLNPKNHKVAAALKACESKLPSFGPG